MKILSKCMGQAEKVNPTSLSLTNNNNKKKNNNNTNNHHISHQNNEKKGTMSSASDGASMMGPLTVQFEYSATAANEASVATGETVRFISKNVQGWVLIEKQNGYRGIIPEDWVLTEDGLTVSDIQSVPSATPIVKTGSLSATEMLEVSKKERRERRTVLSARLLQKRVELEKKERAMIELEEFLLNNQSAAASARMTVIEEDYEAFTTNDDHDDAENDDENEENEEVTAAHMSPGHQRAMVVAEIIETEKSYGKDLQLIVEQFMEPMAQKPELFDARALEFVFSNILEIWHFQKEFLKSLDRSIGLQPSFKSEIGMPFEANANSFKLYTMYCGNHSRATEHIEELVQNPEAFKILEACRLLAAARGTEAYSKQSGIGLDGYLLTPIQRICKYPLLLKELLKATPTDHPDFEPLTKSLEIMKQVALAINEDKRNTEHLILIQDRISNWQGPVLVETSSKLIHEGTLTKISGGKSQERHFYLFDNLLVYCKRNVSGRLVFRGRVPTDSILIKDAEDGKFDGKSFANGMVLANEAKARTYILYAKSPELKQEWIDKFSEERAKVAADNSAGIDRRCRERLNTTTTGGARVQPRRGIKKNKSMKEMRNLVKTESVEEVAREIEDTRKENNAGRVAQFKAVDVKFSISKDSTWASKPAQLFARSTSSIIQEILDRFMLSHLNPDDFDLVQLTQHGGFILPADPIPLFSMQKSVEEPYQFYLHHRQLSQDDKLTEISRYDEVVATEDDV